MRGQSSESRGGDGDVRVLVVEGRSKRAAAVRHSLEAASADFVISPARRLWSACQILAGMAIDAVLLDLELPDSDGLSALYELREQAPEVPLLIVSNSANGAKEALEAGADDVLSSDEMEPQTLGARILEAIERRQAGRPSPAEPSEEAASEPSASILLVEDDDWLQRLLSRHLQRQGHRVKVVDTPQEALAWAEQSDELIDMLICDVQPPGMEGERLSHHLRRQHGDLLTVLVGSERDIEGDADENQQLSLISRPYKLDELGGLVNRLVAQSC